MLNFAYNVCNSLAIWERRLNRLLLNQLIKAGLSEKGNKFGHFIWECELAREK